MTMRKSQRIAQLLQEDQQYLGKTVRVQGWIRTKRDSKAGISFIELNDGSCMKNLQIIASGEHPAYKDLLEQLHTGCAIEAEGEVQSSPGKGQSIELHAAAIKLYGTADPARYPLQKKRHSFEFLRQIAHLRPRTNTLGAVARVRNQLSFAVHRFFREQEFYLLHTPIITTSDCEGAGDIFRVTSLGPEDTTAGQAGDAQREDFFGKPTYLTVSGQLQAEIYALALGRVYTFGPAFRAENSNTSRHLAEFWMIEPEAAFFDLEDNLQLAEALVKALLDSLFNDCGADLEFFNRFIEPNLIKTLEMVRREAFEVITYTEAVEQLKKSGENFTFTVDWGKDLQAEHERYLTEKVFHKPVAIINYPRGLKPFYMRVNDDEKTVAAMDILVPGIGEIVGGSQREERLDVLLEQMQLKNIAMEDYRWYVELREFGSAPHSGFGLGFERFIQFATGLGNIREVMPFPRTPGHADF